MRVRVDTAREHVSVRRVNHTRVFRGINVLSDPHDTLAINFHIRLEGVRGGDQRPILDEQIHPVSLSAIVPERALVDSYVSWLP
jgi:hypothetical protein